MVLAAPPGILRPLLTAAAFAGGLLAAGLVQWLARVNGQTLVLSPAAGGRRDNAIAGSVIGP